ncbi:MAG: acetylhydrolase, partial [SAR86 cluster bacterium]
MQILELLFYLIMSIFLFKHFANPEFTRKVSFVSIAGTSLSILTLHLIFEGPRWQLIPVYFVFLLLLLLCLKKKRSNIILRIFGAGTAGLLILLSAFLSHQLPVLKLPKPIGPFAVGTFSYSVVDDSRIESYDPEGKAKRELFVEVWYPASESENLSSYPLRS